MSRAPRPVVVALTAYGVLLGVTGVALASSRPPTAEVVASIDELPAAVQDPVPPAPSAVATSSPSGLPTGSASIAPSAVPPARSASVAPGQRLTFWPTLLVMPSGASASVDPTGVDETGALVIPQLPDVGVWNGGAQVGELYGSVVIAGHVDSRSYGLGAFAELRRLRIGDQISVRNGRTHLSYRVYRTDQVNQQSLARGGDIFRQDLPNRLVLITCAGPFDPVKHGYRDNYIVYATPSG